MKLRMISIEFTYFYEYNTFQNNIIITFGTYCGVFILKL
jgi:hypothetical protein